jgi:hypothetical protein
MLGQIEVMLGSQGIYREHLVGEKVEIIVAAVDRHDPRSTLFRVADSFE